LGDDDTDAAARNISDIQVRRLPVLTRDKRLVSIISRATWPLRMDPAELAKPWPASRSRVASTARPADHAPDKEEGLLMGGRFATRKMEILSSGPAPSSW